MGSFNYVYLYDAEFEKKQNDPSCCKWEHSKILKHPINVPQITDNHKHN